MVTLPIRNATTLPLSSKSRSSQNGGTPSISRVTRNRRRADSRPMSNQAASSRNVAVETTLGPCRSRSSCWPTLFRRRLTGRPKWVESQSFRSVWTPVSPTGGSPSYSSNRWAVFGPPPCFYSSTAGPPSEARINADRIRWIASVFFRFIWSPDPVTSAVAGSNGSSGGRSTIAHFRSPASPPSGTIVARTDGSGSNDLTGNR